MKCQVAIVLLLALSTFAAEQKPTEGRDKRSALLAYPYASAYSYPYYSSPYYSAPYAYSPYSAAYVASPYSSAYVSAPFSAAYTYYK